MAKEEENFMIAKFMGYSYPDIKSEVWDVSLDQHFYHGDWRLLMGVVEKIESLTFTIYGDVIKYFSFTIQNKYCSIMGHSGVRQPGCYYQTQYGYEPESKIKAVYEAVIEFIKLYNKEKPKHDLLVKECDASKAK